jgi:NitT/TauT family transport system permease protein
MPPLPSPPSPEAAPPPVPSLGRGLARRLAPGLGAIAVVLGVWEAVVFSGWRPEWVLPGPGAVLKRVAHELAQADTWRALQITLGRAVLGYLIAIVVGGLVGLAMTRLRWLRSAFGGLTTGLQTMPSIAWFPLAILLFGLTEQAILFVVVLGAAPSVANGLIAGVDHVPRILLRAGKVLGATGVDAYRLVILPASLPSFIGGMKQAWAFAWRSLMAGELLVIIAQQPALGVRLQLSRELNDARGLLATMIVILVIGIVVDALLFGRLDAAVRRRWGLVEAND